MYPAEYHQRIEPLVFFVHENLPIVLFRNLLPLNIIVDHFPLVAAEYINDEVQTGYTQDDFKVTKHAFSFKRDGDTCYVLLGHMPFNQQTEYILCAKRVVLVMSEKLQKVHYFIEVLQHKLMADGSMQLYYEIRYVMEDEDKNIVSVSAADRDVAVDDEELAEMCAYWAFDYEREGYIGEKGLWLKMHEKEIKEMEAELNKTDNQPITETTDL